MANVSFYLDTRRAKAGGKYPLKIRVRHNGKNMLFPTGFDATTESWARESFTRKEPNSMAKNIAVRDMRGAVERLLLKLESEGKLAAMPPERLKQAVEGTLAGGTQPRRAFADIMREFAATKSRENTIATYNYTIGKLEEYDAGCTFESMDRRWLSAFHSWMAASGLKQNTCGIHLRNIRAVFNYAIDEGYTQFYPFRKFHIPNERTRKRNLDVEGLRFLHGCKCSQPITKYRDLFMLMFYLIGINTIDLLYAKELHGGRLEYRRAKTSQLYSVKVEPEAMEIIGKYHGKEYLLDVMETVAQHRYFIRGMSKWLRRIGTMEAGADGRESFTPAFPGISSYWARHSWASIAAELDIPKETIAAALGHEIGNPTTSIYINFNQKKVDEANRRVIDWVLYGKR